MRRRIRVILVIVVVIVLGLAGLRWGLRLPGQFSDAVGTDRYDCALTVLPARQGPADSAVRLTLEWNSNRACTRLAITRQQITISAISRHRVQRTWQVAPGITPGTPSTLTILRRGPWLGILRENRLIFQARVPHPAGRKAGLIAEKGWTVRAVSVQPLSPVIFADNFMRTGEESGGWHPRSGAWGLHSAWDDDPRGNSDRFANTLFAQNPFAWTGRGSATPALCTTGDRTWEDYTLSVAVLPPATGAAGVVINRQDAGNALLLRWSPVNDHRPDGGQLVLYRLTNGARTVLARSAGGYLPGQWYRLAVSTTLQEVRVAVDGRERLVVHGVTPWRGGIGLYAEGARGATFDDVTAYGHGLNVDLLAETGQRQLGQKIREDKEMRTWADDWEPAAGDPSAFVYKRDCFGDSRLSVRVTPVGRQAGELWLALHSDGRTLLSGYRARIRRASGGRVSYQLFQDGKQLATRQGGTLAVEEEYTVRLRHDGAQLRLEVDGSPVISTRVPAQAAGLRAAYRATGSLAGAHDAVLLGRNVLDYLFTDAPVDWVGEGTWASTVRWACDARWSFLSGWSHGDAVLWHKQRFTGDHSCEAYLAPKMEYPDARVPYAERYCGMGITICGDGRNPRTGYTAVFGAPDAAGVPNRRTILMRQGVVVAEVGLFLPPKDEVHKHWSHLRLAKQGSRVELWVDGHQTLSYTDPRPIAGGIPAVWTNNNGLSLARVRLNFAQSPTPRMDTRLFLDAPPAPAWQNVGTPLVLDFPNACASSGRPVRLQVTPRETPAGAGAPGINGTRMTFVPRAVGVHWYQVTAIDGTTASPSYHLLLPVFNPALGRDNARALVLYYFDDGRGQQVRDHSAVAPALELQIPKSAAVAWQPGRGLTLQRSTLIKSAAPARKLRQIAVQRACTIESWVSFSTLYPPTTPPVYWEGCLCAWGNGAAGRNLSYGFHSFSIVVGAVPGADLQKFNPATCWTPYNHIGLQHQVITWTGSSTRFYVNGRLMEEKPYAWQPESWNPELPLLLGNEPDRQRPFLGTYYLLAIYDRAFTDAQILRHYQAGPSAR